MSFESTQKPLRILHLLPSFEVGGTETQLLRSLSTLDSRRFTQRVCAFLEGPLLDGYGQAHLDPVLLPRAPWGLWRLAAEIRRWRPDIVHGHLYWCNHAVRCLAWAFRSCQILSSDRCVDVFDSPWASAWDRLTFRWGLGTVVNSESVKSFLAFARGLPGERIWVWPNGMPMPPRSPKIHRSRPPWGLLCVARLHEQKGLDILLEALARPELGDMDVRLTLVGDGPQREALRSLSDALGLAHRVEWAGEVLDTMPFYEAADLFVLPSRYEGLPNAVMEAMSHGIPVVASDVGGAPDLLQSGQTGWLVPPEDPVALASAIRQALSSDLDSVGDSARQLISDRFSPERARCRLEEIYLAIAAGETP